MTILPSIFSQLNELTVKDNGSVDIGPKVLRVSGYWTRSVTKYTFGPKVLYPVNHEDQKCS